MILTISPEGEFILFCYADEALMDYWTLFYYICFFVRKRGF